MLWGIFCPTIGNKQNSLVKKYNISGVVMAAANKAEADKTTSSITACATSDNPDNNEEQYDKEALIEKAIKHHHNNELETARELYDQLLSREPQSLKLIYLRGVLSLDLKENQKAVDLFTLATSLNPKEPLFYEGLANAHTANKNSELALNSYDKSLNLNPNSI
ncbi:MAG: hypothetical protein HQL69_14570, partial [Magnetococcales bacterium]|nr:hypothetical protein [Magnetococcales bacterium]